MKIYPIISIDEGQLAVMAAPPGGASLPGAIAGLQTLRIRKVVSLLEPDESQKLALHDESSECRSQGIVYENYPIADYQVPDSMEQFSKFNCTLVQGVQKGVNTVIHCRAGIGRSGLVAIGVLLTQRVALGRAIEQVSAARLEEVPETPAQLNWLQEYEHYRRSEATGR